MFQWNIKNEIARFQKPASGNILYEKFKYLPSEFLPLQKKRNQLYSQIPASDSSPISPIAPVCARLSHVCALRMPMSRWL